MRDIWYYADGDQTVGPIDFGALCDVLEATPSAEKVLVWKEGLPNWLEAGAVAELRSIIVRPPPLPPRSATPASQRTSTISPLSPEYRQPPAEDRPKRTLLKWGVTLLAWAVGFVLARAMGGAFWIPAGLILISFWLLTKMKLKPPIIWMLCVLVSHTLWTCVGFASLEILGKDSPNLIYLFPDVLIVSLLCFWTIKKQSMAACIATALYQIASLITYATDDQFASLGNLAMGVHVTLRLAGLIFAIVAAFKMRKSNSLETPETEAQASRS